MRGLTIKLTPQLQDRIKALVERFRQEGNPSTPIMEIDVIELCLLRSLPEIEKLSLSEFKRRLEEYRRLEYE